MTKRYSAFLSYSRRDALIARRIQSFLEDYPLAKVVGPNVAKIRIYRDQTDIGTRELTAELRGAIADADELIVCCSPHAKASTHVNDEINWFFRADKEPIALLVDGKETDAIPPALAAVGLRYADLRGGWLLGFPRGECRHELVKLVARLSDIDTRTLLPWDQIRQRHRHFMSALGASVVALVIGVIGYAWWSEQQARLATDLQRRLTVASGLLDTGLVPNAVDALSRLVADDSGTRQPDSRRLLRTWAARLEPVAEQLKALPDGKIFRWSGRNFLKRDGKVELFYDGPIALQSAVSSDGKRIATLDADRRLRVRSTQAPDQILFASHTLFITPGEFAELGNGTILRFTGKNLALSSDEDESDAQELHGESIVLVDWSSGRYAVVSDGTVHADCQGLEARGNEIQMATAGSASSESGKPGALSLRYGAAGRSTWEFKETDFFDIIKAPERTQVDRPGCGPVPLDRYEGDPESPTPTVLEFPKIVDEARMWFRVGPASSTNTEPPLCAAPGQANAPSSADCLRFAHPESAYADNPKWHERTILGSDFGSIYTDGKSSWLQVAQVTGNQWVDIAVCDVSDRIIRDERCWSSSATARSTAELLEGKRYFVVNSLELHDGTFQMLDLRSMKTVSFVNPPMEQLADIASSPDGQGIAVLTHAGEVWLYHRPAQGDAAIARRFDFSGALRSEPEVTKDQQPVARTVRYSVLRFFGNDRMVVAGQRGGVTMVEVTGSVVWHRKFPELIGDREANVVIDLKREVVAVFDDTSLQLLSASTGAFLSGVIDFRSMAAPTKADISENRIAVRTDTGDGLSVSYMGQEFTPRSVPWAGDTTPDRKAVEQRTGIVDVGLPF